MAQHLPGGRPAPPRPGDDLSGAAALLADRLVTWLNPYGPVALLAGLVLLTALLTQVINGAAVVGVMTPIAIEAAQGTGLDPPRW